VPEDSDRRTSISVGACGVVASDPDALLQLDNSEDAYTLTRVRAIRGVDPFILASNANIMYSTAQAATKDPSNFFCLREYAAPLFDGDAS
jgi:hypothetical protein